MIDEIRKEIGELIKPDTELIWMVEENNSLFMTAKITIMTVNMPSKVSVSSVLGYHHMRPNTGFLKHAIKNQIENMLTELALGMWLNER